MVRTIRIGLMFTSLYDEKINWNIMMSPISVGLVLKPKKINWNVRTITVGLVFTSLYGEKINWKIMMSPISVGLVLKPKAV